MPNGLGPYPLTSGAVRRDPDQVSLWLALDARSERMELPLLIFYRIGRNWNANSIVRGMREMGVLGG